jgi:hypothetical protein
MLKKCIMKKIITLTVLTLFICAYSFAQLNIYGGGFESWKYRAGWNYYEPDSSIFSTLNILDSVGAGITVYPCDTAHSGHYSAGLITGVLYLGFPIVIPGAIGTLKIDWPTQKAKLGIPYPYGNNLPGWFSGYYQSYPVAGDSSAAVVRLSKWNTSTDPPHRDTIAYNRLAFHGTINSWTLFETPITYRDHSIMPDTLTILLLSCAGFNASNMFGSVGQVGSRALFDDVNLSGFSGFPTLMLPSVNVKLSPNPASQYLKIELGSNIEKGYFEVYDAQAKLIRQVPMNGNSGQIGVSDLSAGMYYYKLTENKKLLNSGTFIVAR